MIDPIIPSPNFVPVITQEGVVVAPSTALLALVNKLPANIAAMIKTAIGASSNPANAASSNLALELNTDVANGTLTGFTYNLRCSQWCAEQ